MYLTEQDFLHVTTRDATGLITRGVRKWPCGTYSVVRFTGKILKVPHSGKKCFLYEVLYTRGSVEAAIRLSDTVVK